MKIFFAHPLLRRACAVAFLAGASLDLGAATLHGDGITEPILDATLSSPVAGIVAKHNFKEGEFVKQGQAIVELDKRQEELEAKRRSIVLAPMKADWEGARFLFQQPKSSMSKEALDKKQSDYDVAVVEHELAEDAVRKRSITAPFDGVITERLVHPGALVGPGADPVLLVLEQLSHLRLVAAVPEEDIGGIVNGARVEFKVPAYPDRMFWGTVARPAHALDAKTRTMPVELDVANRDGALSPGMYPTVKWPVRRARPALLVPRTAVVTTSERTFVIRNNNGRAEWINVAKGVPDGELIEVTGSLRPGDKVVKRATDEIREGAPLK